MRSSLFVGYLFRIVIQEGFFPAKFNPFAALNNDQVLEFIADVRSIGDIGLELPIL